MPYPTSRRPSILSCNQPLILSLVSGFFFVGVAEVISLGLVSEVVLPWVRVAVKAMTGVLSVSGSYDLVRKFTGNGER